MSRGNPVFTWYECSFKDHVSACGTCNSFRMEQPKQPLMPQKVPKKPWSKVDLFTLNKEEYIIVVDDYSKFFEFQPLPDTKLPMVLTSLKSQFARHGIPNEEVIMAHNSVLQSSTSLPKSGTLSTLCPPHIMLSRMGKWRKQ